jgi:hypothetical protein
MNGMHALWRRPTLLAAIALAAPALALCGCGEKRDVPISADGRTLAAKGMIVDGVAYVPVDAIPDACGVPAHWDSASNAIRIGASPATSQASAGGGVQGSVAEPMNSSTADQAGSIAGTVTYYEFGTERHLADVGAHVYLFQGHISEIPDGWVTLAHPDKITATPPEGGTGTTYEPLRHALVDGSGHFSFDGVPPGSYTLVIRSAGQQGISQRNIMGVWKWLYFDLASGQAAEGSWDFHLSRL